jgi:arginyl-tRNA synthetase
MEELVRQKIEKIIKTAGFQVQKNFDITEPPKSEMGDYSTNLAMVIAQQEKKSPKEIAEKLKSELDKDNDFIKTEVAGPGFLNLTLKDDYYLEELKKILQEKENYGRTEIGQGKKVNVEYISANPTGPLHIGNARSGPIGKAFANLYKLFGYEVTEEFYANDLGGQIERFGRSLFYWYQIKSNPKAVFPEDGYPGDYIKEVSEKIQENENLHGLTEESAIALFVKKGLVLMIDEIKTDAALLDIHFDKWSYESEMIKGNKSREIIEKLSEAGCTQEKDGAIWFKQPNDPELSDKESVLVKSDMDKSLTYFANDIAYHKDKFDRAGKDGILIDVWGANHSGHIPRMKAALGALGYNIDNLKIILYQYVRLKKEGKAASMGKRLGNFISVKDVIKRGVKPDAFKYFILAQNPNTPIDFDIDLAADTSEKNPVFYVKYAHARIESILEKAGQEKIEAGTMIDLTKLNDKKEKALYREIVKFPGLLSEILTSSQIQTLPHFAYKIAALFHDFYSSCRVISEDKDLTKARLSLILATKYVIANVLAILDIKAPKKM